MRTLTHTF